MANYCCVTRSSYFHVTDEEKYKEFMKHIITVFGDIPDCWSKIDNDRIAHAFGCYGQILGYADVSGTYKDYDYFLQKLSEIIAPGSACVIMRSGNEKLRYVDGIVDVVMSGKVVSSSLEHIAHNILRDNDIDADDIKLYY